METRYNAKEWAAETTRGRQVFNYNYRMHGAEIKGWKLAKVVTMQENREATERVYLWQSKAEPVGETVRISVTERHNWRLAQESLKQHLSQCMRPDIPRGTKDLARLGDVVFVGREPKTDIPGAVAFARGNVFVSVSSAGERNLDVSGIAASLDGALSELPATRALEKGQVRALSPRAVTVKANEAHVLIEDLKKLAPEGKWLKTIVPDGELSRKDDALIYVSPDGGKKQVGIFAMSGD